MLSLCFLLLGALSDTPDFLKSKSKELTASCPEMTDEYTRLDSVTKINQNTVQYYFPFNSLRSASIDTLTAHQFQMSF